MSLLHWMMLQSVRIHELEDPFSCLMLCCCSDSGSLCRDNRSKHANIRYISGFKVQDIQSDPQAAL